MTNHKRPYNMTEARRRSVYVDGATWEALKKLGSGNASEGIRKAVRATGETK